MNVTALLDTGGDAVERYVYDPYGQVTILNGASGVDEDGAVTEWTEDSDQTASDVANAHLYCGYYHDSETGLYHVRWRVYHPTLGRWLQRDPLGYVDGMGLYEYGSSRPPMIVDPQGLSYEAWEKCSREGAEQCRAGWDVQITAPGEDPDYHGFAHNLIGNVQSIGDLQAVGAVVSAGAKGAAKGAGVAVSMAGECIEQQAMQGVDDPAGTAGKAGGADIATEIYDAGRRCQMLHKGVDMYVRWHCDCCVCEYDDDELHWKEDSSGWFECKHDMLPKRLQDNGGLKKNLAQDRRMNSRGEFWSPSQALHAVGRCRYEAIKYCQRFKCKCEETSNGTN